MIRGYRSISNSIDMHRAQREETGALPPYVQLYNYLRESLLHSC